jgi:hypothetical protein
VAILFMLLLLIITGISTPVITKCVMNNGSDTYYSGHTGLRKEHSRAGAPETRVLGSEMIVADFWFLQ